MALGWFVKVGGKVRFVDIAALQDYVSERYTGKLSSRKASTAELGMGVREMWKVDRGGVQEFLARMKDFVTGVIPEPNREHALADAAPGRTVFSHF